MATGNTAVPHGPWEEGTRHTGSYGGIPGSWDAEGVEECGQEPSLRGTQRQGERLRTGVLNNLSGFWGTGTVLSSLIPGRWGNQVGGLAARV